MRETSHQSRENEMSTLRPNNARENAFQRSKSEQTLQRHLNTAGNTLAQSCRKKKRRPSDNSCGSSGSSTCSRGSAARGGSARSASYSPRAPRSRPCSRRRSRRPTPRSGTDATPAAPRPFSMIYSEPAFRRLFLSSVKPRFREIFQE